MTDHSRTARIIDCKVCSLPHNDEIHEATLRVHRWLRYELMRKLSEGLEPDTEDEVLSTQVA